jgi:outer membrane immunogenic protein
MTAMLRNLLISAGALLIGLSMADSAAAQSSRFDGFYIGGQGHYSYINVDIDVAGVGSADDNLDGFGGGGFIGFGGTNKNWYGGIEAEVGYDNADWSESIGGTTLEVETQLTFGVSARLGAVLADRYLLYARAGWVRTQAEASVTGFGSEDEWFDGFRFGGGLEGFITDNFAVRTDYTYTIYNDPTNISGVDFDVNQHLFRVGGAYYF